ncbi:MAG TPA: NTP transferase domain-containing protein [Clostridia bacterium]|nr:NTP transferase domain-containing protein [Clostridia bacterium]
MDISSDGRDAINGVRRAAAVIIASRPLEPADSVRENSGDGKELLPAMIRDGQVTFIERVIIRLQLVGAAPVVVITGFENEQLERHLAKMSVVCLNNPNWRETTVFDDAIRGLSYTDRTCKACEKIWLATPLIPSVGSSTLEKLLMSENPIALPVFEGEDGLPMIISRKAVPSIVRAEKGRTLQDLIAVAPGSVDRIPVSDQGVLSSMGDLEGSFTQEYLSDDLAHLPMRACQKLILARETLFFGPGPATLLRLIDEIGSVRTACIRMKLSYSKGWQILNLLEEQLGANVIDRKPGGQEGGSSSLTALGRDLLHRYEQLVFESQKSVNQLYDKIFADFPAEK